MKKRLVIGLLVLLVAACSEQQTTKTIVGADGTRYTVVDNNNLSKGITMFENNVYYFNYVGMEFPEAVSQFLNEHKDLEVSGIGSDNTKLYGSTGGYCVTFRAK